MRSMCPCAENTLWKKCRFSSVSNVNIIQIYQLTQIKQSSLMSDYRLLCSLVIECFINSVLLNVTTFTR